jgi:hypothetical protein
VPEWSIGFRKDSDGGFYREWRFLPYEIDADGWFAFAVLSEFDGSSSDYRVAIQSRMPSQTGGTTTNKDEIDVDYLVLDQIDGFGSAAGTIGTVREATDSYPGETVNAGSIGTVRTVTVEGAAAGQVAQAAITTVSAPGVSVLASVTGANTVSYWVRNDTGSNVVPAAGTVLVRVLS